MIVVSHNRRDGGNKFIFIVIIVIKADSDCGNYSHNRRDGGNKFIFIVIIVIKADSDCGNYSHNHRDGRNKFIFIVIIVIKADSDCGNYSHNHRSFSMTYKPWGTPVLYSVPELLSGSPKLRLMSHVRNLGDRLSYKSKQYIIDVRYVCTLMY